MKRSFLRALIGLLLILCNIQITFAAGVTLVDFGSSSGTTTFGLTGWNTLLKSGNLSYTAQGGGGLRAISDPGEYGDYRGIRGTPRKVSRGERIAVTWFNDSEETISFTSRISFTDEDEPNEAAPDGNWYTMRGFTDYRFTYTEIAPGATAKTVFDIEDSGVHKTDEIHSVININLAIEWGSTYQKQSLICDKIELLDDADIVPPGRPTGLTANVLSDSKIQLHWNAPTDNVGVVDYLIHLNGAVEGYSQSNDYACVYLEPNREYSFSITALDAAGNESAASEPSVATTRSFQGGNDLINPAGFEYLGAFELPEAYTWGGEAIAYNPDGDGGPTGSSDDYPGSLFVTNLNQPENGLVGEVSVPSPVISQSKNVEDLNQAAELTTAVNIRPANVNAWEYVDIWRTGLDVVPEEGRLYSAWSIHYTVGGEKHASISCCDASNLSGSVKYGAWTVGPSGEPPIDAMMNDWLFSLPRNWADANCSGRNLVVGRCRDGGLSGLGPTLYAFAGVGNTPPPPDGVLPFTTLLQYGPVEGTDNVHFPNSVDGYNHADEWRGAMWISAGNGRAVAIVGNKALGYNWYGYSGERMRHDWVIADVPWPDFYETDPDGKGWRAHGRQPMIILYDAADLAAVAAGAVPSWKPQPYAALRLSKNLFFGANHEIFSASFDSENRILYVTEFVRETEGRLIIHAWKVNPVSTSVRSGGPNPSDYRLFQNHPNPFNPSTTIRFSVKKPCRVKLRVYDVHGREIATPADARFEAGSHSVRFDATGLPSGLYLVRMQAGVFTTVGKMAVMK
jgi:hypothetical protein